MPANILLVDDDPKVLEILEKSLTRGGHTVSVARDGEEALINYKESPPDMVVLDLVLPDMDGRDVLKIMRTIPGRETIPVLFLSANSDPDVKVSTLNSGADDFLTKPFSLKEFKAKLGKVLGSYNNTRILQERNELLESEIFEKKENYIEVNKELKRQLLSMNTVFTVGQDLNQRLDLDELINRFSLTLVGELQLSSVAVFAVQRERNESFSLMGLKGLDKRRLSDLNLVVDSDFSRRLLKDPKPHKLVRNRDKSWVKMLPDVRLAIFEYVTPIVVKQKLIGVVFTGPKMNGNEFRSYDLDMIQLICNSAGVGIENARLFRELQSTYLSTVKALVSIIEAKDPYTKGHTERVADYSVALGAKLRLPKDDLRDLAFAAVLHDIGKLVVYERILNKTGSLSDEEWDALKEHPRIGASIIENMDFLAGTVPMVLHHHEHWDGGGYPEGLRGEDIPLGARVISIADSYDAMTTDRAYRKALDADVAIETLQAKAGTQFDPEIVDCFVELVRVDRFKPRNERKDKS